MLNDELSNSLALAEADYCLDVFRSRGTSSRSV